MCVRVPVEGEVGGGGGTIREKKERGRIEALCVIVQPAVGTGTVSEQR